MPQASRTNRESVGTSEAVYAPLLRCFADVVNECGGDPAELLGAVGINANDLQMGGQGATYRQTAELLERAAVSLNRPDFGLLLASRQCREGVVGPLGEVMRHLSRFGEVLDLAVGHGYAHSLASRSWLKKSVRDQSVVLGHDILVEGLSAVGQAMEQILLIGHLNAMRLTGNSVRARKIFFRHQRISSLPVYRRYFGCAICFDQSFNGTLYHEADLAKPILSADTDLLPQMLSAIEMRFTHRHLPLSRQMRSMMMQVFASAQCTNIWIANKLDMHPRTLHRKLREEGTSFHLIREQLRQDFALYYLQRTDLDFTVIANRLGFSEQAVLTRSCRRWFGHSPTEVRHDNSFTEFR